MLLPYFKMLIAYDHSHCNSADPLTLPVVVRSIEPASKFGRWPRLEEVKEPKEAESGYLMP